MEEMVVINRAGVTAKIDFHNFFQETLEKGYRTRIARMTLYEFAKAVRSRTKMYYDQRTEGLPGVPSRGDMPGSLGDAFEFKVKEIARKVPNTVTFEVGKGFVYAEMMNKPRGTETELFSAPQINARYFSFREGEWRFFSTTKPVRRKGIGFFSDALDYTAAHDLQRIFDESITTVLAEGDK